MGPPVVEDGASQEILCFGEPEVNDSQDRRAGPSLRHVTTYRLAGVEVPRIGLGTNRLTTASERAIGKALEGIGEDVLAATTGGFRAGEGRPEVLGEQIERAREIAPNLAALDLA